MKTLASIARQARRELYHGSGVARVSKLDITMDGIDDDLLRCYYLAFGVHLGKPLSNYGRLYSVEDQGGDYTKKAIPVSQIRATTRFHTDSSAKAVKPDLVGLLCVRPASLRDGASRIACGLLAYDTMKSRHPELCALLEQPHYRDILTPGADASQRRANAFPVFAVSLDNSVCIRYMRFWIEKGYEKMGLPQPPRLQEALDTLDAILEEQVVTFTLERGEMLWVHNTTVLHDRTAYEDDPAINQKRLLLRQWVVG